MLIECGHNVENQLIYLTDCTDFVRSVPLVHFFVCFWFVSVMYVFVCVELLSVVYLSDMIVYGWDQT